jgi:hypothetical protein
MRCIVIDTKIGRVTRIGIPEDEMPEDMSGTYGDARSPRAIRNARHPEHKTLMPSADGLFDRHAVILQGVTFDDPLEHWGMVFKDWGRNV